MKRLTMLFLITLFIFPVFAVSIVPNGELEQTFDSIENLKKFDFNELLYTADSEFYDQVKISLITVDPGDEVYVWFGHSAIEIVLPEQVPLMVDYGVFAFSDSFYFEFAMGRLYYIVHMSSADSQYRSWAYDDRGIARVELNNLTPAAKKGILEFIQYNCQHYTYLYHHYEDNCATRPRDILNAATQGAFKAWAESKKYSSTYREISGMYMRQNFPINFALNFIQSGQIDKPINYYDAMFLPDILGEATEDFFGTPHVVEYESEARVKNPRKSNLTFESFDLGIILAILFFLLFNRKKTWLRNIGYIIYIVLQIVLVAMSIVLLFMMLFTNHEITYYNENIIFINPLLIIGISTAIAAMFKKRFVSSTFKNFHKGLAVLTLALVVLKGIFPSVFIQDNLAFILFTLPINIVLGFFVKQRKED